MSILFSLKNVEYCHGQGFKLDVPQLDLMPKAVHIIAGPEGSGKSTFLQLLALFNKPTKGEVWFKGENLRGYDYEQLSVLRLQLTMVGQSPCLFSGKVYYNLAYGLQIRGIYGSEQEQRINKAIRTFGLCGYEKLDFHLDDSSAFPRFARLERGQYPRKSAPLLTTASLTTKSYTERIGTGTSVFAECCQKVLERQRII